MHFILFLWTQADDQSGNENIYESEASTSSTQLITVGLETNDNLDTSVDKAPSVVPTPQSTNKIQSVKRKQTSIVSYIPKKISVDSQKKLDYSLLKLFTKDCI